MVCAICGRMPLMMQSAPMRRAAATVFIRCCATSVSTVGTPVMSMMAIVGAGVHDPLQQVLHDHLGARAVEGADQGQRQHALPQLHDRRGELQQFLLLPRNDFLAALLIRLGIVRRPSLSTNTVMAHTSFTRSRPCPFRMASNSGCLMENTNMAVSAGVKPESPAFLTG